MAVLALTSAPSAAHPQPIIAAAPRLQPSAGTVGGGPVGDTGERAGSEALSLAGRLHRLAQRHREAGEEHEAEPLLRRALAIQERSLGPTHPHVALTLSSLMFLYRRQGKEEEAAAAAARAATILAGHARQFALEGGCAAR